MIEIHPINESFVRLGGDTGELVRIWDDFSFEVPGAQFNPRVRMRVWDGKIHLLNGTNKTFPRGLVTNLVSYCKETRIEVKNNVRPDGRDFDWQNEIHNISSSKTPRDFQLHALAQIFEHKRKVIVSSTGSGKSFIIYCAACIALRNPTIKKILLITPSKNLVEQMYTDFIDYDESETIHTRIQRIHSGIPLKRRNSEEGREIVISTWQNLIRKQQTYLQEFDMVIADECHLASSKSFTTIFNNCTNAAMRVGFTGTLKSSKVHELVLEGSIGPAVKVSSTSDLIEKGTLADLTIKAVILKYGTTDTKGAGKYSYQEEKTFIVDHIGRNRFIGNLCANLDGNVLLLIQNVDHARLLRDLIEDVVGDTKRIIQVDGSSSATQRALAQTINESHNNVITIATYGIFSTGVNIVNLHHVIMGTPYKSKTLVLQSIGRGLRKGDEKDSVVVYDIVDDISGKRKAKNYLMKHFIERFSLYTEENLKTECVTIDMPST